jgi:hypothetical protein
MKQKQTQTQTQTPRRELRTLDAAELSRVAAGHVGEGLPWQPLTAPKKPG